MVDDAATRRRRMVERDLAGRGITDRAVLDAMATVPRERFLPGSMDAYAYEDGALPIAAGQTISQPFIVAAMAAAAELTPASRVLEVGTGSGYGAAVLASIAAQVWTIERHHELVASASTVLRELGFTNVHVTCGDGSLGLPEQAPFDAIVVTAGAPAPPAALVDQLIDGGRLVIPVGPDGDVQQLMRIRRRGDGIVEEDLGAVRFVPLIGDQGWPDDDRGSHEDR